MAILTFHRPPSPLGIPFGYEAMGPSSYERCVSGGSARGVDMRSHYEEKMPALSWLRPIHAMPGVTALGSAQHRCGH